MVVYPRLLLDEDTHMTNPIPEIGYLRLRQIIGDRKAKPSIPPIIPVSASTWWAGVASGRFPKPVKLSSRITVWRAEEIRAFVEATK